MRFIYIYGNPKQNNMRSIKLNKSKREYFIPVDDTVKSIKVKCVMSECDDNKTKVIIEGSYQKEYRHGEMDVSETIMEYNLPDKVHPVHNSQKLNEVKLILCDCQ